MANPRRRLAQVLGQLREISPSNASSSSPSTSDDARLRELFGAKAYGEGPLARSGAGRRFHEVDLSRPLSPEQVSFILDALAEHRIISFPGQDLGRLSLARFERFANHFGALVPHPQNFTRDGKDARTNGDSAGKLEVVPPERRTSSKVDQAFPGELSCMTHESPAVLVVNNILGGGRGKVPKVRGGTSWHTDIEYEPIPLTTSMFLVQKMPTTKDPATGNWVPENPRHPEKMGQQQGPKEDSNGFYLNGVHKGTYFPGSDAELMRLREELPLNGETAYTDTAAAFAALPKEDQQALEKVMVRRRLNAPDEGWLAPLVVTNPRTGVKSLHSPVWASRPKLRPPIEVDSMSPEDSRAFLDKLEAHILRPEFRYDHPHRPGDVTIWNNQATMHNAPPMKESIGSVEDARLMYRLSTKGPAALTLPREDTPAWIEENINPPYATPLELITDLAE